MRTYWEELQYQRKRKKKVKSSNEKFEFESLYFHQMDQLQNWEWLTKMKKSL